MELEHDGELIVLAVPDAVLGRTAACEVHVSHPLVSRRHCRIEATPDGVFVEDLGSSNGTYLNGARLSARSPLRQGDVVQIGQEGPRFELLLALVDGRDVAGPITGDDEATIVAGDPRVAALRAHVSVSPDATVPAALHDEEATRVASAEEVDDEGPASTTGSIPVAVPLDAASDADVGRTALWNGAMPEPPTGLVGDADATRAVGALRPATTPAGPPPDEMTRPVAALRPATRPGGAPFAGGAPFPGAGATTVPAATPPASPAPRRRRRGGLVVLGFLLGLAAAVAAGVLTPLGPQLHALAPWGQAPGGGR